MDVLKAVMCHLYMYLFYKNEDKLKLVKETWPILASSRVNQLASIVKASNSAGNAILIELVLSWCKQVSVLRHLSAAC